MYTREDILRIVREEEIDFIRMQFTDIFGQLKNVAITSSQIERAYRNETHHHMICTECGQVAEFQNTTLREAIGSIKLKRFTASHYSLYIYGICSKCVKAKNKKTNNIKSK